MLSNKVDKSLVIQEKCSHYCDANKIDSTNLVRLKYTCGDVKEFILFGEVNKKHVYQELQ